MQKFVDAPDTEKTWNGETILGMSKFVVFIHVSLKRRSYIIRREAYCLKKMEEKGIKGDVEELRRSANLPSGGSSKHKFNAFRDKAVPERKKNGSAATKTEAASGEADAKPRQIQITYGTQTINVNPDGTIKPEDIEYPKQSVILFSGLGDESRAFSDIKVSLLVYRLVEVEEFTDFWANLTNRLL